MGYFFGAVDVAQADTLRVCVVQAFAGVAIEEGANEAGEVGKHSYWVEQERKKDEQVSYPVPPIMRLLRNTVNLDLVRGTQWDILVCTRH